MDGRVFGASAAVVGLSLLAWTGWGAYVSRTTERVPYTEVDRVGDVEIRGYPEAVAVTTRAEDEDTAFRRLFEYISGTNRSAEEVSMTAPVATDGRAAGGEDVSMTAPVRTDRRSGRIRMEFFLPADYTPETAPQPTDPRVDLVIRPPRTVAVLPFSGYARKRKTKKKTARLLDTLEDEGIETVGEPFLWQYNDPYTPPFMRHNEVAVDVAGAVDLAASPLN